MYRLQKIISSVVLAATSFLAFLVFSQNISFYTVILALVAALSTWYCYSAQLFIGMPKQKRRILDWTLFILCLAVFFVCHSITFNFKFICVAIIVMALAYLYLYGHVLFPLRKIVWLKLIVLSFIWTFSCAVLPVTLFDGTFSIKIIFETIIFATLVLALSLPFEKRDAGVDAINNYTNIYTRYGLKKFKFVFILSLMAPILFAFAGWLFNLLSYNLLLLTMASCTVSFVIFHSTIIAIQSMYVMFDILFLGWIVIVFLLNLF